MYVGSNAGGNAFRAKFGPKTDVRVESAPLSCGCIRSRLKLAHRHSMNLPTSTPDQPIQGSGGGPLLPKRCGYVTALKTVRVFIAVYQYCKLGPGRRFLARERKCWPGSAEGKHYSRSRP